MWGGAKKNTPVVGITRKNTNAAAQLVYLHKFRAILEDYFRTLREESIRDNFVLIYELLDETMDFGHPQFTEPSILKECVAPCPCAGSSCQRPPPPSIGLGLLPGLVC